MAAALLSAGIVALALCGLLHDEWRPIAAGVVASWVGLGFASRGQPDAYRYGFVGLAMLSIFVVTIAICAFVACDWMAGSVGLMSILLGLLLMRQHVVTKTNFLERIVVAFEISKQTPS